MKTLEYEHNYYQVRRYEQDHGQVVRVVIWFGYKTGATHSDGKAVESAKVVRFSDGCYQLDIPRGYLYPMEMELLAWAVQRSVSEAQESRKRAEEEWHAANDHLREHDGCSVDLSIAETKEVLENAELCIEEKDNRWGGKGKYHCTYIRFQGEWLELCRTDLKDDVCTSTIKRYPSLEALRREFLKKVKYGARLKRGEVFAVVDAYSDG